MTDNIAGIGKRVCGGVIDLLASLVFLILFGAIFGATTVTGSSNGAAGFYLTGTPFLICCVLVVAISAYLEFKFGKTPGKYICKMKVVSESGAALTLKQAAIRNLLRFIDGIFLYAIGFIIILIDKKHQRLGDLVAKTVVINDTI